VGKSLGRRKPVDRDYIKVRRRVTGPGEVSAIFYLLETELYRMSGRDSEQKLIRKLEEKRGRKKYRSVYRKSHKKSRKK